ncbi:MAG: MaoC family dehydratase N-terminal domain-containing protein, partial [Caulobacterales bacterium]
MPLTPELVAQGLNVWSEPTQFSYGDKDVMLYALGIGYGRDPMNETELKFVYENDLRVVPTAATVLAAANPRPPSGKPAANPGVNIMGNINFAMMLHGEQRLEVHKPLPVFGMMSSRSRTSAVVDKGAGRGAVIYSETEWTEQSTGDKVCTLVGAAFARADGGFGGSPDGGPPVHEPPKRAPDKELAISTREDQALLYRLNGDRNPLHSDP